MATVVNLTTVILTSEKPGENELRGQKLFNRNK